MWGQVKFRAYSSLNTGIIPTRVGTRSRKYSQSQVTEDHPHACGDKLFVLVLDTTEKGSSPRVWGQAAEALINISNSRIIPTRVGTRISKPNDNSNSEDHPHACGDKYYDIG